MLAIVLVLLYLSTVHCAWPSPGVVTGDISVHDPTLIKKDSTYYLFCTHGQIQTRVSTDRVKWTLEGSALSFWGNTDLWAPDITLHGSTYWLLYCRSTFGSRVSEIYLATSSTMAPGSWADKGVVIASNNTTPYNAIDPAAIQDSSGKWWVVFGSWSDGIYVFSIDSNTGKPTSTPTRIAERSNKALEGPILFSKDGYFYLFMSFGNCCPSSTGVLPAPQEKYHIVACRSKIITGPYTDATGASCLNGGAYEVLEGHDKYWALGGQAVYHDSSDNHDLLVYHWYDSTASYSPKLGINFLNWTSGWPVAY